MLSTLSMKKSDFIDVLWLVALQAELHDVSKEMELDLLKQYQQVGLWYNIMNLKDEHHIKGC